MSLSELCQELNNWFDRNQPKVIGKVTIDGGALKGINDYDTMIKDGQYFRVIGSAFNDGVYSYPHLSFIDETFDGAVWAMAVPPAVIALSKEIDDWIAKYGGLDSAAMSPFQSESFGGYSYSKGASSRVANSNGSGNPNSWQSVFADRMKLWRKACNYIGGV